MRSPTERSLKHLRDRGYLVEVLEHWIPMPVEGTGLFELKKRKDPFGVDLEGVHPELPPIRVQTTSSSNHSARVAKLMDPSQYFTHSLWWVRNGGILEVHSWGPAQREKKLYWRGRIERAVLHPDGQTFKFERVDEVLTRRNRPAKRRSKVLTQANPLLGDIYGFKSQKKPSI